MGDMMIGGSQFTVIAGPCLLEDEETTCAMAERLRDMMADFDVSYIFKASYDKANRTSIKSARGPGWQNGLAILQAVKERTGVPIISDVHETLQVNPAAEVLDMLQIPAFLCRQTDLLVAAGETGLPVNIKKGQFMAPEDMEHAAKKVTATGNQHVTITERGTTFGYHNLVVDMRGVAIMRQLGYPVIFDATHSVQLPGGAGGASGGQRELAPVLARAAVAAGVDGVFMEVHPEPDTAPCDGPNMLPFDRVPEVLSQLLAIRKALSDSQEID
ncbi:MAG: 3-deoxy-8-phosphooctulonate synthase [Armatimonadota bacterium]